MSSMLPVIARFLLAVTKPSIGLVSATTGGTLSGNTVSSLSPLMPVAVSVAVIVVASATTPGSLVVTSPAGGSSATL